MTVQTSEQLINYYADLLIYQYISKPRAHYTVYHDVAPVLMPQGFGLPVLKIDGSVVTATDGNWVYNVPMGTLLPLTLQDAFTFDTAVGVQLDTLAEYIGGIRTNLQLDGTYLTLTDVQFRLYLQALGARNTMGSDMKSIETFFATYFPGAFLTYDFESMHMSFIYNNDLGVDPVAESFIMAGHIPVPTAVGATVIFNPTSFSFFAFRTYNAVAQPGTSGYNFYSGPQTGRFLSYINALNVPFN